MSGVPAGAGSLLGKRLGKYEILALLALGGTAEIYLARIGGAAGFEKYVVVKCLHDHLADDQTFVKMFLDEARLAACLDHSNIVQTMELGEYNNRYFMVMEFLAGLSLAMIVRRAGERLPGGKIPTQLVLNMVAQSCAGLHYAHERTANGKPLNMVHRDISPQNLVISFEGVVKIVDFGIAKAELRETKTQSGTIKGKFAYMSPEQCIATNVDRRTDVFAIGVIAHELLTGGRLFKKASPYETYQAVIECDVPPPSKLNHELDPALDPIIMKAVAKDKEARYPTAEAFGDAILGYLHHRGKGSSPNDVSRWFDQHFAQEIEEHGARMRELINGREVSVDTGVNWDGEEEDKAGATRDLGGKAIELHTQDLLDDGRASASGLSELVGSLDSRLDADNEENEEPVERTRIEANPLEKLRELDNVDVARITGRSAAQEPPKKSGPVPAQTATGALPLPAPPAGPLPQPRAVITPPGMPKIQSGKFPDLTNIPTVIAETDPPERRTEPELAPTALAARALIDPSRPITEPEPPRSNNGSMPSMPSVPSIASEHPTQPSGQLPVHQSGPLPVHQSGPRAVHPSGPQAIHESGPRAMHGSGPQAQPHPTGELPGERPPSHQLPRQSLQQLHNLPTSYPVMDKQMSDQMAAGATVFPSERGSRGEGFDPHRAADLASPVGGQLKSDVDWAKAAAAPARAIPKWMLALIFLVTIGVALGITVLIARLVR